MSEFLTLWGKRAIEILLLAAVLWGVFIHSAFWAFSSSVLFCLLGLALCVWAGTRLFARDSSAELSQRSRTDRSIPPFNIHSPWIWAPIVLLSLLVIFQTVPLPVPLVELLSPKRVDLAQKISEALPELETGLLTLSVDPDATRRLMPFFLFPLILCLLASYQIKHQLRIY